jgi:hypothetical protein
MSGAFLSRIINHHNVFIIVSGFLRVQKAVCNAQSSPTIAYACFSLSALSTTINELADMPMAASQGGM